MVANIPIVIGERAKENAINDTEINSTANTAMGLRPILSAKIPAGSDANIPPTSIETAISIDDVAISILENVLDKLINMGKTH